VFAPASPVMRAGDGIPAEARTCGPRCLRASAAVAAVAAMAAMAHRRLYTFSERAPQTGYFGAKSLI
jgi:hypothetical protein